VLRNNKRISSGGVQFVMSSVNKLESYSLVIALTNRKGRGGNEKIFQ
jgi:hypothetical protein